MSLAIVNLLKLIDSGAIHLIGSLPFDAITQGEEPVNKMNCVHVCRVTKKRLLARELHSIKTQPCIPRPDIPQSFHVLPRNSQNYCEKKCIARGEEN